MAELATIARPYAEALFKACAANAGVGYMPLPINKKLFLLVQRMKNSALEPIVLYIFDSAFHFTFLPLCLGV